MENVIVGIVVLLAAWYLFRRFYSAFKRMGSGCSCESCPVVEGEKPACCESRTPSGKSN